MKGRTILLVEDIADDELLTLRALKKNKIANEVIIAHDGQEALNFLFGTEGGRLPDVPALVLLDLKLPKVDGIEVLKKIRSNERTRFMPVVILTSSGEESDVIKGYENGTNSYIRKPVDFEEFVEVVKHVGMYWLLLNEAPTS